MNNVLISWWKSRSEFPCAVCLKSLVTIASLKRPSIHFIIANWPLGAMFRLSGPSRPGGEGFLMLNEFLIPPPPLYDFGAISKHQEGLPKNLEMNQNILFMFLFGFKIAVILIYWRLDMLMTIKILSKEFLTISMQLVKKLHWHYNLIP